MAEKVGVREAARQLGLHESQLYGWRSKARARRDQSDLEQSLALCSMSAKGNCYDNFCAESFFHSFKVEAIHGERFMTRDQMRQAVFEYIEVDYNRTRRHSANGFISPEAFEAKQVA